MKDKKIEYSSVQLHMASLLEEMRKNGVELFVDGHAVLPDEAVRKAVRENSPYMADFVFGNAGVLEQVRFDRVIVP